MDKPHPASTFDPWVRAQQGGPDTKPQLELLALLVIALREVRDELHLARTQPS